MKQEFTVTLKFTNGQNSILMVVSKHENKRKPGNPLSKYTRKRTHPMEQLEYKVAMLERELLKKNGEIVRLKKSIELERGDAEESNSTNLCIH